MNTNPNDELFSTYYDGETSPEERTRAEEQLETSDAARQELEEIGELSSLLQSLPTQTAPVELAASVMKRAERESLLPTPSPSIQRQTPRKSRILRAIGVLSTSVALIFVVFLVNKFTQPGKDPEILSSSDSQLARTENSDFSEKLSDHSAIKRAFQDEAPDDPAAEGNTADPPMITEPVPSDSIESFSRSEINHSHLRKVEIGDVIPYFAVSDGQVAVVEVTVIDVQKAIGTTQLLLEQNQIPQLPKDAEESTIGGGGLGGTLFQSSRIQKTDDGLFAVYIESTQSQLEQTMKQLNQQGILAELKLKPPVELQLVELAQGRPIREETRQKTKAQIERKNATLAEAVAQGRAQQSAEQPSKSRFSVPAETRLSAKSPRESALGMKKKDLKLSKTQNRPTTDKAFQMLVNVQPKSLDKTDVEKKNRSLSESDAAIAADKTSVQEAKAPASSKEKAESAPIRLILIFQELPPVEAPKPK